MSNLKPVRLKELKIQAVFLLKDLRSTAEVSSRKAASRFLQISDFSRKTDDWLIAHADAVQLKHAYKVIAYENNYDTWAALKHFVIENDCLYKSSGVAYIHQWFNNYRQAEAYHQKHGGYLLAFWKDFVVCGKEYINCIGLGNYEAEWKNIGYNWIKPANDKAFLLLKDAAKRNYLAYNSY